MFKKRFKSLTASLFICVVAVLIGCSFTPEPQEFTFVNFSDIHVPSYSFPIGMSFEEDSLMQMHNQKRLQQLTDEILAMDPKPAFVINSGDTGDAGWTVLLGLYHKLMQPLVSAGIPVYTVVGNHDLDYAGIGRQDLAEIFDTLGPERIGCHGSRYSFDYGGCHFVIMNNRPISGLIRFNPMDIEWLRKDLETIDKDMRVLLFLHANMQEEDTHHIVKLLQQFRYPVIFQGHRHSSGIGAWGGIPVVLTGSLYGGNPKAGSYRLVKVGPDSITLRTRDFAETVRTPGHEELLAFLQHGPVLKVIEPENDAIIGSDTMLAVETDTGSPGTVEYSIPGVARWTQMQGGNGKWEASAPLPSIPGRYFLAFRYRGENGSIVLAHRDIRVPGDKVREEWSKELGSAVQGSPVIWNETVIIPTIESGVYALQLGDGAEIWHNKYKSGQILGRMAAVGALVYYGAGRTVYACDAQTGAPAWSTTLEGTIVAGITAENGRLFVPAGEKKLYCLDAAGGEILWEYSVTLPIIMETAAADDKVFFGAMDGYFRALDSATGKEIWKNQWSSMEDKYTTAPFWPPVVAGDRVIACKNPAVNEEKNLVAFSVSDGKILWSREVSAGTMRSVLSPQKDRLYTSYRENRRRGLQCFSVSDGSTIWKQATSVSLNAGFVARGMVLQRDAYNLCCVDGVTGEVLWTYHTSPGPQGSYYGPGATAVRDNIAVAGTMGGHVFALSW